MSRFYALVASGIVRALGRIPSGSLGRAIGLPLAKAQLVYGYRKGLFSYSTAQIISNGAKNEALARMAGYVDGVVRKLRPSSYGRAQNRSCRGILFLTSTIAKTGGHSRLLKTYMARVADAQLVVTANSNSWRSTWRRKVIEAQKRLVRDVFPRMEARVAVIDCVDYCSERRIHSVLAKLKSIEPRTIVLFNDNTDIAALIAVSVYAQIFDDTRLLYYHHADDYCAFMGDRFNVHIDIDSNQDAKCGHLDNRRVIRIAVPDRRRVERTVASACAVFSFAPLHKTFDNDGKSPFLALISKLTYHGIRAILATGNGHGRALRRSLGEYGADLSLISIDEDCRDINKYAASAGAYIDTFPIGGGMSVVDALSAGIPVVINGAEGNQVFRDHTLRSFVFRDVVVVESYIRNLFASSKFRLSESERAYAIYRQYYAEEVMVNAFSEVIDELHPASERVGAVGGATP